MMYRTMQKLAWFGGGLLAGLTALSISKASTPKSGYTMAGNVVTDDTALYQKLSEINLKKEAKIDFDSDINHLSSLENRYRERLPLKNKTR